MTLSLLLYLDIDECSFDTTCGNNSMCENTNGSFNCHCDLGFSGNGFICEGKPFL